MPRRGQYSRAADTRHICTPKPRHPGHGRLIVGLSYGPRAVPSPGSAAAVVPGHGRLRTALNRSTHAARACALPFKAGQDRPRPTGCPPTFITLSDREVPGERAQARLMGQWPLVMSPWTREPAIPTHLTKRCRPLSLRTSRVPRYRPGAANAAQEPLLAALLWLPATGQIGLMTPQYPWSGAGSNRRPSAFQVHPGVWRDSARHGLTGHLAAEIGANRGLLSPGGWPRWLPFGSPFGSPELRRLRYPDLLPCRNPWVVPVVNLGPRCRQRNAARDSGRRRHECGRTPTAPRRHDSQTVLQPASEFGLESARRSASARGDPRDPWCPGQARCRPGERSGPRPAVSSGRRRGRDRENLCP
jgi:hypothetical protein